MKLDVDRLRRRPPGPRVLMYLDQSTLSDLALQDSRAQTRELLLEGVKADKVICPGSVGHTDETLDARQWETIQALHEELAMGVAFLDQSQIEERETWSAVAAFCGAPPYYSLVDEAFAGDPQTPRDELFPGGMRVAATLGPALFRSGEVAHEKGKEAGLQQAYDAARALGRSYQEQADAEYEAMVSWTLGPLVDPDGFADRLARKQAEMLASSEWSPGPGTPTSQYLAAAQRGAFAEALAERYPLMAGRWREFAVSDELAHMPAIRFPALFRAAIAVRRGRNADAGDGYDIAHLTRGLSRCDIVTADRAMTAIARERSLVPSGCALFRTSETGEFHAAVEAAIAAL